MQLWLFYVLHKNILFGSEDPFIFTLHRNIAVKFSSFEDKNCSLNRRHSVF